MIGKWLAFTCWFGALGTGFFEQQTPPSPSGSAPAAEQPAEDIRVDLALDVVLVEFDVSVHDRKGDFIPGLERERFHLFEDGKEVPITDFEEVVHKTGAGTGQAHGSRSFLFFVDTYLASTLKVGHVRRDLQDFFRKNVVPGDSVSLAVLGPRGSLQVTTGLDGLSAIETVKKIPLPPARFSTPLDNSYDQARHVLSQVEDAVSQVLDADVPPPRNLIFLSPGFVPAEPEEPFDIDDIGEIIDGLAPAGVGPMEGPFDPRDPFGPKSRRYRGHVGPIHRTEGRVEDQPSIQALMSSLAGWLSARNITLYSINCGDRGPLDLFGTGDSFSASVGGGGSSAPGFAAGLSQAEGMRLDMLEDLAELTGGMAWLNSGAHRRALHNIDEATATVYRIGFRPDTDRPRGRYHKLKIAVDGVKKVKVRHPRGYLDS